MISLVIPIYNEEKNINELYNRILSSLKNISQQYEIIFIDDGSTDNSFQVLKHLSKNTTNIKIIRFSRNFGHQIALTAGIEYVQQQSDAVIMMDADLQHPPELLPELIKKWQEGYEIVYTIRQSATGWNWSKRITSKMFYKIFNLLSCVDMPEGAADFRLLSKKVVKNLRNFKERSRFMRGLINWLGYPKISIPYTASSRFAGSSKYSLKKMLAFAIDGIASFSSFPLYISGILGIFIASLGFLYSLYAIGVKIFTTQTIPGWTSLIVITLLLGGIQLITLGVLGIYLGKVYEESKQRPLYIIQEKIGFEDEQE